MKTLGPSNRSATVRRAFSFDRSSLGWRFSWILLITAVVTVTAFGLFAYRTARATTLAATHTRLRSVLEQLNTIAELGIVNQLDTLRGIARDPSIIDALRHPDAPMPEAALSALRKLQGNAASTTVVELRRADSTVRYATDSEKVPLEGRRPFGFPVDAAIGPMYDANGVQSFDADVSIVDAGTTIGGVRFTRRLVRNVNRRLTSSLLGENSAFLIGNSDGTLWAESERVSYPILAESPVMYERNGIRWVSASAAVRGTPWLYAVEIPERVALAPARALLTPFLIIGSLIAIAVAFAGLRVSRRITAPLADLTAATEAIARGERNVTLVATDRRDEIGRLARAFGTMATSVRAVQDQLELDVDTRTVELTQAVGRLHELDDELRRNERFATIGRLSGSVGHELRNPLGVMSTIVFLLDSLPDASPKLKDYASLLREQIRLSERIINDLLDRARLSAPVHANVNLPRFLDDVITRAEIPSTVRVERHVPDAMPDIVLDRDHVGQILWNLLTNAVQAMHGTGTIRIDARLANGHLRIELRDSGPGIPLADIERVFEPLFTTKVQGVGLGLSVSRAFARSNGGDLFVAPPDGSGACFVLDLPVTARTA